jgi:hypothetical protein
MHRPSRNGGPDRRAKLLFGFFTEVAQDAGNQLFQRNSPPKNIRAAQSAAAEK